MSVHSKEVSVGTTATRIDTAEFGQSSQGLAVKNMGAATVYLGGPDVSTANGYPLLANEAMPMDLGQQDELFGRVASGTVLVRVLEVAV